MKTWPTPRSAPISISEGSRRLHPCNCATRVATSSSSSRTTSCCARGADEIANVRTHETTRERPVDHFPERAIAAAQAAGHSLRHRRDCAVVVSPHARVEFDANRYSVPPHLVRQTVMIHADIHQVRVVHQGQVVAQHARCYERRQLIVLPDHRLAALTMTGGRGARRGAGV